MRITQNNLSLGDRIRCELDRILDLCRNHHSSSEESTAQGDLHSLFHRNWDQSQILKRFLGGHGLGDLVFTAVSKYLVNQEIPIDLLDELKKRLTDASKMGTLRVPNLETLRDWLFERLNASADFTVAVPYGRWGENFLIIPRVPGLN